MTAVKRCVKKSPTCLFNKWGPDIRPALNLKQEAFAHLQMAMRGSRQQPCT